MSDTQSQSTEIQSLRARLAAQLYEYTDALNRIAELEARAEVAEARAARLKIAATQLSCGHPGWCEPEVNGCSCGLEDLRRAALEMSE